MESGIILSFLTLSLLEIVLGIDNLIFIALVAESLPKEQRQKARIIGLSLALGIRVAMLASLSWIMQLTEPLFTVMEHGVSIRDMLLIAGGIFLIGKSTLEIHADMDGLEGKREMVAKTSFRGAVIQIVIIDIVFSFDSIMTAVGIADNLSVMVAAVVVSMIVMIICSGHIAKFLRENPTFKMLALAFILMIGTVLVAEGMHIDVPKAYIYFAFGFSILVEALNTLVRRKHRKNRKADPEAEKLEEML
ncbi:MAG: TerC family protein [Alphaproteobacteria bacterium]